LEKSVTLVSPTTPITVAQGIAGLAQLRAQLTPRQAAERQEGFARAAQFIQRGPAGGGIAPTRQSFPRGSAIRVDVEILSGVNFRN
jgi:hypothetical protein